MRKIRGMVVMFNDEVHHNSVDTLIQEMRGLVGQAVETQDRVHLYFSTNGGEVNAMYVFIEFLNHYCKYITVHIYDRLHSCGVDLLYSFEGDIKIHHRTGVWMILHNGDRPVATMSEHGGYDQRKLLPCIRRDNKRQRKALQKLGLSKGRALQLKKGKNVYLFSNHVKKLTAKNIEHVH